MSDYRTTLYSWHKDLNWLAVLTDLVYKLELHAATVIGTTLTIMQEAVTRPREAALV